MLSKRARTRLVVPGVALSLALSACSGGESEPTSPDASGGAGGTFSTHLGEPTTLVPTNTTESEGNLVESALFTGLISYDPGTSQPVNAMAESIESPDNQTWTITIQDGWTFHDGTPVTAQSYVDAWNYGAYGPNAQQTSYFFEKIQGYVDVQCGANAEGDADCAATPPAAQTMSGLTAPDETTLQVVLDAPFSQFPLILGYNAFYPLPASFFDDPQAFNEEPVGNGPYRMDGAWRHDEAIDLVRFEEYAGEAGQAERIELRIYADSATAYTDVQAGNLDILDQIPPEQIATAEQEFGDAFIESPRSDVTFIEFPLYLPEFTNPDLRRAFSMAINREEIVDAIFQGSRQPAYSFISPVVQGFRDDEPCDYCQYDPAEAKRLLEAAGGWEGPLTLWFNQGGGHDRWMEAVANQLRSNLGIQDIQFQQEDFSEYIPRGANNGFTGPMRMGWVMDYPSPQNYLEGVFASGAGSNYMRYNNPEVDRLLAQGNAAESIEAGIEDYLAAEDIILDELPAIPMWFGLNQSVHSENVGNVSVDAFGNLRLAEVEVVNG